MKLICPDCGKQYDSGKFCLECGAKLQEAVPELVCPSCGFKAKSGKFCPECGTKLTEQIVASGTAKAEEAVERKFNERDERFAKYYDRKGFPRNIPQEERDIAIEELTPFADQNIAEAKMLLGNILLADHSNEEDCLKGIELIKEAEQAGDKLAYYFMSVGYYYGITVEQNHNEAECRLLEAYKEYQNGDIASMLADLYTFSEKRCDYVKALKYATIAVEDDEELGYFVLGTLYHNGWGVEKNQELALENYKMAAAHGNEAAMNQIGFIFMGDDEIEANPEQSFYWFNEAAKKGSDVGMCNVGYCYKNGFGVEADVEQAAEWYKKSAEMGYADAMCELGEYYQETLIDFKKAKMWYLQAAELGNAEAQNKLAVIYSDIENDHKEAIKWYKKAMEQDNPFAYRNYAHCLWNGHGVKEDKNKALEMMRKAISFGLSDVENELNEMQQDLAEDGRIENVQFETDGRNTLYVDLDCILNKKKLLTEVTDYGEYYDPVYLTIRFNGKKLAWRYYGDAEQEVNHERIEIKDFQLRLNTDQTSSVPLTIELQRDKDYNWVTGQGSNNLQTIFTNTYIVNLYREIHIFGKNILEIRD